MWRKVGETREYLRFLVSLHKQRELFWGTLTAGFKAVVEESLWMAQSQIKLRLMWGFVGTEIHSPCMACVRLSGSSYHNPAALYAVRLGETDFFVNLACIKVLLEHFALRSPFKSLWPHTGKIPFLGILDLLQFPHAVDAYFTELPILKTCWSGLFILTVSWNYKVTVSTVDCIT